MVLHVKPFTSFSLNIIYSCYIFENMYIIIKLNFMLITSVCPDRKLDGELEIQ